MDYKGRIFSASEIDKGAPLSTGERLTLVRLGVLKPLRTRSGWAVFGEDDMAAACQWASQKTRRHRGGRKARR